MEGISATHFQEGQRPIISYTEKVQNQSWPQEIENKQNKKQPAMPHTRPRHSSSYRFNHAFPVVRQ